MSDKLIMEVLTKGTWYMAHPCEELDYVCKPCPCCGEYMDVAPLYQGVCTDCSSEASQRGITQDQLIAEYSAFFDEQNAELGLA